MRGSDARSGSLFTYVDLEQRVPAQYPLRVIKAIVDDVHVSLDAAFAHTLIEAWASQPESFRAKDGNDMPPSRGATTRNFHGERRVPATMGILVSNAYLCGMCARVITMLAIFAVTVVTTVASARAARMSVVPHHTMYAGEIIMYASGYIMLSCDGEQHCGSADAGLCEFVCTGFRPS